MTNCKYCGSENADYVINPYHIEMNDTKVYEWICSECYSDLLMSV